MLSEWAVLLFLGYVGYVNALGVSYDRLYLHFMSMGFPVGGNPLSMGNHKTIIQGKLSLILIMMPFLCPN